jgi:hypothetical protein
MSWPTRSNSSATEIYQQHQTYSEQRGVVGNSSSPSRSAGAWPDRSSFEVAVGVRFHEVADGTRSKEVRVVQRGSGCISAQRSKVKRCQSLVGSKKGRVRVSPLEVLRDLNRRVMRQMTVAERRQADGRQYRVGKQAPGQEPPGLSGWGGWAYLALASPQRAPILQR